MSLMGRCQWWGYSGYRCWWWALVFVLLSMGLQLGAASVMLDATKKLQSMAVCDSDC